MTVLLWFRRDLRLADNPALAAALAGGEPVVPVFVRDDADAGDRAPGGASRWWLHGSLASLGADLAARGAPLVLRTGPAATVLAELAHETGAGRVVWSRRYEPWARAQESAVATALGRGGVRVQPVDGGLLHDPERLRTGDGRPYSVFSPFWRALRHTLAAPAEIRAPERLPAPPAAASERLEDWSLQPTRPDWAGGLRQTWTPGEAGAQARLDAFLGQRLMAYADQRNLPAQPGTSQLSPHLHFGEIGPWQVVRAVMQSAIAETGHPLGGGAETFLSEIGWREFSYHLLAAHPHLPDRPLREAFNRMPWRTSAAQLQAWQRGRTGYPIVDAGLRQLWRTGWMHNRVRMIVASFLTKDLLIDWREGEAWFWDTLVDADLANNAASWQWVAGCGADAAPYFRVFNPVTQGQKFDPDGAYVRRWVPEIARLPTPLLHAPWLARPIDLAAAGIALGVDYPAPMVDHAVARTRALAAYEAQKSVAG